MKNIMLAITAIILFSVTLHAQNVGIGTTTPNASSLLELSSSNKGLLIPRLGSGQRTSILTPAKGLMVYDTTTASFWLFNGALWDEMQNASGNAWAKNGNNISSTNQGYTAIGRNNPFAKLDVFDTIHSPLAVFTGGDRMFLTLAEKNINRGYIGSYAGNPEDVDFGTYGNNNTGKVHLTTANIPRLTIAAAGNVGINNTTPDASAALDISSINKGVVLPRLTTAQREAIANPATGLLLYDISYNSLFMFDGYKWMTLAATDPADLKLATQTPGDAGINEVFGAATGIDSLYAIVGAPYQNGAVGAAYIYKRTNNVWAQMTKLTPDISSFQLFGGSVSIDFPYAVVGASEYNGSQGAVYVFYFNGSAWVQQNKFLKTGTVEAAQFGFSVDIDNNYIVVGAPSAANIAAQGGAVFTYKLNASVWSYHNTLTQPGIAAGDNFGYAVAISDSFIVIGSPSYDNGVQIDEGIAYKFKLNTLGTWAFQQTLTPIYGGIYYNNRQSTWEPKVLVKPNWKYKQFGKSVDIKYNSNGVYNSQDVFTVVGAPGSYFKFDNTQSAVNLGIVNVFLNNIITVNDSKVMALFGKDSFAINAPGINEKNVYYGSSVSLSNFKGKLDTDTTQIDLQVLIGSPGYNNNKGRIDQRSISKVIISTSFANYSGDYTYLFNWDKNYSSELLSSYSENMSNAQTGYACSIFDANSYIVSLPGINSYKGGIIFKF